MASYTRIDLDFEPYAGPSPRSTGVFVRNGQLTPIQGELGKGRWPNDSPRQAYFESQVARIARALKSRCLPVHFTWRTGEQNQLDKGCIGHSFASENSFVESIARNRQDEITHIIIRNTDA